MIICVCENISDRTVHKLIALGCKNIKEMQNQCPIAQGCGKCSVMIKSLLDLPTGLSTKNSCASSAPPISDGVKNGSGIRQKRNYCPIE